MMQNFQPMKQERSYVFSFQPYGLHQAIPSFPTRRSSDLIGAVAQQHRSGPVPGRGLGDVQRQLRLAERGQQLLLGEGDRKSTRLNSSHVAISYAVFCLKKKKNNSGDANKSEMQTVANRSK